MGCVVSAFSRAVGHIFILLLLIFQVKRYTARLAGHKTDDWPSDTIPVCIVVINASSQLHLLITLQQYITQGL